MKLQLKICVAISAMSVAAFLSTPAHSEESAKATKDRRHDQGIQIPLRRQT